MLRGTARGTQGSARWPAANMGVGGHDRHNPQSGRGTVGVLDGYAWGTQGLLRGTHAPERVRCPQSRPRRFAWSWADVVGPSVGVRAAPPPQRRRRRRTECPATRRRRGVDAAAATCRSRGAAERALRRHGTVSCWGARACMASRESCSVGPDTTTRRIMRRRASSARLTLRAQLSPGADVGGVSPLLVPMWQQ